MVFTPKLKGIRMLNGSLIGCDLKIAPPTALCNGNQGGNQNNIYNRDYPQQYQIVWIFGGVVGIREILANSVILILMLTRW